MIRNVQVMSNKKKSSQAFQETKDYKLNKKKNSSENQDYVDSPERSSFIKSKTFLSLPNILKTPLRKNVKMFQQFHALSQENDAINMHLSLTFYYDKGTMEMFMPKSEIPDNSVTQLKKYHTNTHFFPFCIFNSISQKNVSWTYIWDKSTNQVEEKIEMNCRLTFMSFSQYYPFELKVLLIKIGTDGTFQTGKINLLPLTDEEGKSILDLGVFGCDSNNYCSKDSDYYCKVAVKSMSKQILSNLDDNQLRVYTSFFYESMWLENTFKFIVVPSLLMLLMIFGVQLEVSDTLQINITLILTVVASFFTLPDTEEFTATEQILTGQVLFMVAVSFLMGFQFFTTQTELLIIILVFLIAMSGWLYYNFTKYKKFVRSLKLNFEQDIDNNNQTNVFCEYSKIDEVL